jgi:hypothetical protein
MAAEQDTEIEDELARGKSPVLSRSLTQFTHIDMIYSSKTVTRPQGEDLKPIQEELCARKGCSVPRFQDSAAHPECASQPLTCDALHTLY